MKVINFFAGPNSGKSVTAAGLFYVMKIQNYNVELVTEYAKDMVWEKRSNVLKDQLYILAKQNRRLERLREIDWVITDSPIILGLNYTPLDYYKNFQALTFDAWQTYNNLNFYLTSSVDLPYQSSGREQTKDQAKEINLKVLDFLISNQVSHHVITITPHVVDPFKNHIVDILNIVSNTVI